MYTPLIIYILTHLTGDSIVFETHGGRTPAIVISSPSAATVSKKVTKKVVSKQFKGETSSIQHTPTAAVTAAHSSVTPVSAMVGSSLIGDLDSPGTTGILVKGGKRGRKREPVTQDVVEEKVSDSPTTTAAVEEVVSVDSKRVRRGRRVL